MLRKFLSAFIALYSFANFNLVFADNEIKNDDYKFKMSLPSDWKQKDIKETLDHDAISYSFENKDKSVTVMLLAFKLSSIKNLDDFIYTMEKDVSLNIPKKSGDYTSADFNSYDMKSGIYKDSQFFENIYYIRTKLVDAPNNYVYMLRFICGSSKANNEVENQMKSIAETFKPTAE